MKPNNFIKKVEYPGGRDALRKFVHQNLRYPKEALLHKVEGSVHLKYEVNDRGKVHSISVVNSLGYGCDDEAIRIVGLLKYPQVKNRGIKVTTKFKLAIHFRLPTTTTSTLEVNYIYIQKSS